jgi:Domain of unknown function (DUF4112)
MQPVPSRLVQLRRWAVLLDSAFKVPGLPVRFGLDAIAGLIPGVGELTTPAFTMLLLFTGVRMRVPLVVLGRMVLNTGVDALIGLIPLLGDLTDIGWKANLRNLELLERHAVPGTPVRRGDTWFVAIGIGLIVLVALLAIVSIVLAVWVIAWLIGQRGLV